MFILQRQITNEYIAETVIPPRRCVLTTNIEEAQTFDVESEAQDMVNFISKYGCVSRVIDITPNGDVLC